MEKSLFVVNGILIHQMFVQYHVPQYLKTKGHPDAYEMSMKILLVSNELKIHIVGGLHPDWKFEKYLEIVREVSAKAPDAHIKAFTAVETDWFSRFHKNVPDYYL